jgi:hypothetical protein
MQALLSFRWLLALPFWLAVLTAHASHILGGELTYAPITSTTAGIPRYHVRTVLYRDITGVDQHEITLVCNRNGCGLQSAGSFSTTIERSQVASLYSLGCPTAPGYNYQVYFFETDVDLPRGQWTLSVTSENRVPNIRNITNSGAVSAYISAFLDNSMVAENTSPKFLSTLLPYLCGTQAQRYSFSAFDSDGDSLAYSFRYPEENRMPNRDCGTAIQNSTLSPHFQLNPATGGLTTQAGPVQAGIYSVVARVSEYRRVNGSWQPIGYVTRDISYLAFYATNTSPRFTGLALNAATTTQPVEQLIRVQPGQTLSLALNAADADASQHLRFASQAPDIIPGLSLTTLNATQANLTWRVPASLRPGRYTATIAVLDDGCPVASEEQTLSFLVGPQVLASRPALAAATTAFPMPFREQVQFQAASGGQLVNVVDELGRTVAQLRAGADGRVQWQPAASLPAGLYLACGADGRPLARLLRAAN